MGINRFAGILLALAAAALPAHADAAPPSGPELDRCIAIASESFGVPEIVLRLLLDVEGGTVGQVSWNTNNTYDISAFQVNSSWLPRLARLGITEEAVTHDLCVNTAVAAWIFAKEYERLGHLGRAIAHYHSPTPRHQARYLGLVERAIQRRLSALRKDDGVVGGGR